MKISFTLDEEKIEVEREIGDSVLDILREDCQKKEIKQGCSPQGACGSCMVVINGKPRLTCTLRAKNISNKTLQTAESVDAKRRHKLEQAFISHGATGCGYCMPAILHQVTTLLHHVPQPSESLINKALHMHSCPCLGFSTIKRAIQTVIQDKDLPGGNLHPRGRLALRGKRTRVADISVPDMLHLIPVFTDRAIGKLEKLNIPETPEGIFVLSTENSDSPFFQPLNENFQRTDAVLALVLSEDKSLAKQYSAQITAEYSETPQAQWLVQNQRLKINDLDDLPSNVYWSEIQEEIPSQDAGYIETEACFVMGNQIIVNGLNLHALKSRYPEHQLESWAAGGSFGGRTQDNWVDWAVHAATILNRPVLLSLSMEDSIRIRPKSPPAQLSLSLGYQKDGTLLGLKGSIIIDGGSRPQLCVDMLETICINIQTLYQIPFINLQIDLISKNPAVFHPLQDQGLRIVSVALEASIENIRQKLKMDALSIRLSNLKSADHQKILESIREPYLETLKNLSEDQSLGLACSAFTPTKTQSGKIRILIEEKDLIVIQGSKPDTGDSLEYQLIETLHQRTGIPLENIAYEVSSAYSPEPTDYFLQQKALLYACSSLIERLQGKTLAKLTGEIFEGEAIYDAQDQNLDSQSCFTVSFALLSPKKIPLKIYSSAQGQIFENATLAQAHLQGIQYRSLGLETIKYQENSLPSVLFRQLNLPKAKESPSLELQFQPDIIIGIEASLSASIFASASAFMHNTR